MTHAEIGKDKYIKARLQAQSALGENRAEFKLKRFQQVDPRTSTKRGDHPFMSLKMGTTGQSNAQWRRNEGKDKKRRRKPGLKMRTLNK